MLADQENDSADLQWLAADGLCAISLTRFYIIIFLSHSYPLYNIHVQCDIKVRILSSGGGSCSDIMKMCSDDIVANC